MQDCVFCHKKMILKFIMSVYELRATDIAREIHVSDSLVRKHLDGVRKCPMVDDFLLQKFMGVSLGDQNGNSDY